MENLKENLFLVGYVVGIGMGFLLRTLLTLPDGWSSIILLGFGVFLNDRINKEMGW